MALYEYGASRQNPAVLAQRVETLTKRLNSLHGYITEAKKTLRYLDAETDARRRNLIVNGQTERKQARAATDVNALAEHIRATDPDFYSPARCAERLEQATAEMNRGVRYAAGLNARQDAA